jgi:CRISPR-associated endonuclease Cas2
MLLDYGDRLQFSVFEAQLSDDDLKDILDRASKYVEEGDSFRVYSICKNCLAKVWALGRTFKVDTDGVRII